MKVLFIAPSYYPHIGGAEYVVKSIVEEHTSISRNNSCYSKPNVKKQRNHIVLRTSM
jgi:hypothetical protein